MTPADTRHPRKTIAPLLQAARSILVVITAAVYIAYGAAWLFYLQVESPDVAVGFAATSVAGDGVAVSRVRPYSEADRGGLRDGDRIIRVGDAPASRTRVLLALHRRSVGERVTFTVVRAGSAAGVEVTVGVPEPRSMTLRSAAGIFLQPLAYYPIIFLAIAVAVLTLRPDDPFAWLVVFLFGGFLALPAFPQPLATVPEPLRQLIAGTRASLMAFTPPLFYIFGAVFPTRSPLDRQFPWLRWPGLALGAVMAWGGLETGEPIVPASINNMVGPAGAFRLQMVHYLGGTGLGIVSLLSNAVTAATADQRRRTRLVVWGAVLSVAPRAVAVALASVSGVALPVWLDTVLLLLYAIFPMSFAYAVVKHRVLDLPVLLQRSARYLLVRRGFLLLVVLLAASVTLLFTTWFQRLVDVSLTVAMFIGVGFGILLSLAAAPLLRQVTRRIDRAFFRSAYDASTILQNLAETIRGETGRQGLAEHLVNEIDTALHPLTIALFLETGEAGLRAVAMRGLPAAAPLSRDESWLRGLEERGQPIEVSQVETTGAAVLRELAAELLVPIVRRGGRIGGLVVLGPKASEELYSGSDRRLLASVAAQTGVALDNLHLAERIAERLEAERAARHELTIAREVQLRLFPQRQPPLQTFEYGGGCVQAQQVGGDYYDFLDLGNRELGLVLADISGKGIAAALLMANLQANLRSQHALASRDLPQLMRSVNQLLFDSTDESHYATVFFAHLRDASPVVDYVNCGHLPPLLLREDGAIEWLMSTATVVGLFEEWDTPTARIELRDGDLLVAYTDGVVEPMNAAGEQFGTERLLETVRAARHRSVSEVITAVQEAVRQFTGGSLPDDLTILVGRARYAKGAGFGATRP